MVKPKYEVYFLIYYISINIRTKIVFRGVINGIFSDGGNERR